VPHQAYLRRARAWRELRRFTESASDYDTFLRHVKTPSSAQESNSNLNDVRAEFEAVKKEIQREAERRDYASSGFHRSTSGSRNRQAGAGFRRGGYSRVPRSSSDYGGYGENVSPGNSEDEHGMEDDEDYIFHDFFDFYGAQKGPRPGFTQRNGRTSPSQGAGMPGTGSRWRSTGGSTGTGNTYSGNFKRGPSTSNFSSSSSGYGGGFGGRPNGGGGARMPAFRVTRQESTHYTILGVERGASSAEIKKAYHKLALKFHPGKSLLKPERSRSLVVSSCLGSSADALLLMRGLGEQTRTRRRAPRIRSSRSRRHITCFQMLHNGATTMWMSACVEPSRTPEKVWDAWPTCGVPGADIG
jgi:curved DNA-binding protein CbpA